LGGTATQALPEDAVAIRAAALTGDTATIKGPNVAGLRDWASTLTASLSRSAHHATDLANRPITWLAVTMLLAGLAAAFARGDNPSPVALQLVDGLHFPMLRWPAERLRITSPLANRLALPERRPRRTRPLRVRKKA
jgi:hypothetical protein